MTCQELIRDLRQFERAHGINLETVDAGKVALFRKLESIF